MLRSRPPASDEDAFEAVVCLFVCGEIENALHVARSRAWKLEWARQITGALAAAFRAITSSTRSRWREMR